MRLVSRSQAQMWHYAYPAIIFTVIAILYIFSADRNKQEMLSDLILFWTGYPSLPTDTRAKLVVRLLQKTPNKVLPEADTCPRVLLLPTIHEQYGEFRNAMDKAIEYAKCGFGKM